MRKYTAPKVTYNSIDERGLAIPAIIGVIAGVALAKVASKAVDKMFESSISSNVKKLEPLIE